MSLRKNCPIEFPDDQADGQRSFGAVPAGSREPKAPRPGARHIGDIGLHLRPNLGWVRLLSVRDRHVRPPYLGLANVTLGAQRVRPGSA